MKKLLDELEQLKTDKDFIKYGFSERGGKMPVISKLKLLSKSKNNLIAIKAKLLVMLAYAYATSRGAETDHIKTIKKELKKS